MSATQRTVPVRSATDADDLLPDEDSSETTKLFHERLQAWKHACGSLEDYISATEKHYSSNAKEYEKVTKTVTGPLREAHHFDQAPGGIAGLFESLRTNTQGLSNNNAETAKALKGSVLPLFERLHVEIKNKTKELSKSVGKGAKAVDKSRTATQKHVELLGQHSANHESSTSSPKAHEDPYILHRQVYHRLNKQVNEENNNRDDMLGVQDNFSRFETHILQTFQQGLAQFNQVIGTNIDQTRALHGTVLGAAQSIPPDFEWNGFLKRNENTLIDPNAPKRTVHTIGFANQDHKATKPLIAGTLERKGKMLKSYSSGYYAVTPSKYLHEFKTDDDFAKDPSPENSLYLPDCLIGAVDGNKFNVRGKDSSKGGFGNAFSISQEYAFKAPTPADAQRWHDVIASVAGQSSSEKPAASGPNSPVAAQGENAYAPHGVTQGATHSTAQAAPQGEQNPYAFPTASTESAAPSAGAPPSYDASASQGHAPGRTA